MPRKTNTEKKEQLFTDEELLAMTPADKLKRVADLEKEIKLQRQRVKDERASAKDFIDECEAKISTLLESIEQ